MDNNSSYIPQYLDEPERFLLWTIDEALAFFLPLFVGIFFEHPGLGFLMGPLCMVGIKKFKKRIGYKFWLYWHFPTGQVLMKSTPPSAIREYVG